MPRNSVVDQQILAWTWTLRRSKYRKSFSHRKTKAFSTQVISHSWPRINQSTMNLLLAEHSQWPIIFSVVYSLTWGHGLYASCGEVCLQSKHSGGWSRRIMNSRLSWAAWWDPISVLKMTFVFLSSQNVEEGQVCLPYSWLKCTTLNSLQFPAPPYWRLRKLLFIPPFNGYLLSACFEPDSLWMTT